MSALRFFGGEEEGDKKKKEDFCFGGWIDSVLSSWFVRRVILNVLNGLSLKIMRKSSE